MIYIEEMFRKTQSHAHVNALIVLHMKVRECGGSLLFLAVV